MNRHTQEWGGDGSLNHNSQTLVTALAFILSCIFLMVNANWVSASCGTSFHSPSAHTHVPYLYYIHPYWFPFSPKERGHDPTIHPFSPLKSSLFFRDFAVISNSSGFSRSFIFLLTGFLPLAYTYAQNSTIRKTKYHIRP